MHKAVLNYSFHVNYAKVKIQASFSAFSIFFFLVEIYPLEFRSSVAVRSDIKMS